MAKDPSRISLSVIARYLPESPVIVEAGAHTGGDTRAMARRWRTATMHAFEPLPDLFAQLERNVRGLPGVHCYRLALGPRNGHMRMWVSSGASDGSSSLRRPKAHLSSYPDVAFAAVTEVTSVTLDAWAREHDVEPDLLWLDLQGGELDALAAGETVLDHVRLIHAEVSVVEEYEGQALYPEVRIWLQDRGFSVLVEALPEGSPQGNVLFGRHDRKQCRST